LRIVTAGVRSARGQGDDLPEPAREFVEHWRKGGGGFELEQFDPGLDSFQTLKHIANDARNLPLTSRMLNSFRVQKKPGKLTGKL